VINEIARGFPVLPVLPCEGVGYEIGSTAIIKGTRNLDAAKKFVDYALSPAGQQVGLDVKEYAIPTNRGVTLPPQVPNLSQFKVIDYDFAKYGASAERKRLLERWSKDHGAAWVQALWHGRGWLWPVAALLGIGWRLVPMGRIRWRANGLCALG